jgi:biopolymer transport protein ExbD
MTPSRLAVAGLSLVLLAVAFSLIIGNVAEPDSFNSSYNFELVVFLQFLIGSLGGAGIFLILRGAWFAVKKDLPARPLPRIFPEIMLRNLTAWNRRAGSSSLVMSSLNAFSVSWICVLMTLVTIFMILSPPPPNGLRIDWTQRSHISAVESPWPETMSVYIGRHSQVYVNGKAIERQELEKNLRAELARRAVWTVYLEADDDTTFSETVFAMDTIQGVGAKVVWITPMMRAEWQKGNHSGQQ